METLPAPGFNFHPVPVPVLSVSPLVCNAHRRLRPRSCTTMPAGADTTCLLPWTSCVDPVHPSGRGSRVDASRHLRAERSLHQALPHRKVHILWLCGDVCTSLKFSFKNTILLYPIRSTSSLYGKFMPRFQVPFLLRRGISRYFIGCILPIESVHTYLNINMLIFGCFSRSTLKYSGVLAHERLPTLVCARCPVNSWSRLVPSPNKYILARFFDS